MPKDGHWRILILRFSMRICRLGRTVLSPRTCGTISKALALMPFPEQKGAKKISGDTAELLAAVNERYGIYSAKKLEEMTHSEPPWQSARGNLSPEARCNKIVKKSGYAGLFRRVETPKWATTSIR